VPSNEQRRQAAKRKLERQLERRAERARKRKQMTIVYTAAGVVVAIAVVAGIILLTRGDDSSTENTAEDATPTSEQTAAAMPAGLLTPLADTVSCSYTPAGTAAKPSNLPNTDGIPTTAPDATPSISMETSQGNIGLILDGTKSPCTVNSFVSLAGQNYFDATTCHRLTTSPSLEVLQCGDPTGTGSGGPGYQFDNEYPTTAFDAADPAAQLPVTYSRGTIAMANAGAGTNGSQFFLVYGDSQLPPDYTVFGTIDETGLATLDKIAAGGSTPEGDGTPNLTTDIKTVRID
jgi:peptidyl-prolyl cis-trans isomerase B (cyclophilin B)